MDQRVPLDLQVPSDLKSKYIKVKVKGDGSCFFRAIAAYCVPELLTVPRDSDGTPLDSQLCRRETETADNLRALVVKLLLLYELPLQQLVSSSEIAHLILLEHRNGEFYTSIREHVEAMRRPDEYATNLEVYAISFLMKQQVCVFQYEVKRDETGIDQTNMGRVLKHTFPPHAYLTRPPQICLLLTPSSSTSSGHYDILHKTNLSLYDGQKLEEQFLDSDDPNKVFWWWQRPISNYSPRSDPDLKHDFMDIVMQNLP